MFKRYQKKAITEARPYVPGEDMSSISVNMLDVPCLGGMIARNPANHADQWYINEEYFKSNYEEL